VVELALAAADAAEIEPQHGEATLGEHVKQLVRDLVVHRPAELRMRMKDQRDRAVLTLGWLEAALKAAGGAGKNDFGHRPLRERTRRTAT
jgi:hypothetical protein